ncbi:outer membrane beta-barrel protein [Aquimarina sp. TRL1]|uniref:outer membrane beta-barrel protein n=1 Tax=Aquimarina sp. (strain TRL1) TaxID=2736252 RepID=UPI00158A8B5E|nr:outer membrane beta-barrel protein [Aquimarina sp. TRL1]QKX04805.1 outer membrane beta-barrel protein [Aquimarina sp. TRL1]
MKDKKNIDRLFQEKFKDFEVTPDPAVWERIKVQQHQRKKRRVVPLWFKIAGVAAIIAIIVSISISKENPAAPTQHIVVNEPPVQKTDNTSSEEKLSNDNPVEKIKNTSSNTAIASEKGTSIESKSTPPTQREFQTAELQSAPSNTHTISSKTRSAQPLLAHQKNISKKPETHIPDTPEHIPTPESKKNTFTFKNNDAHLKENIAQNSTKKDIEDSSTPKEKISAFITEEPAKKSIFDAITEKETNLKKTSEKPYKKWSVTPNAAPVYYGSVGNGSSIDPEFADNNKSSDINISYGVQVAYKINKKLSIRSGVNKVTLGYGTENVGYSPAIIGNNLESIDYAPNANAIVVSDIKTPVPSPISLDGEAFIFSKQNPGLLNQNIRYIEIPIELKYTLTDQKIGIHLIGGFSSLFLDDNSISISSGDFETNIGKANNINDISYSSNLGLGLDYKLSKHFLLNLEPIFKYQINGFNSNAEDFKPYYFGVYTGVSFSF